MERRIHHALIFISLLILTVLMIPSGLFTGVSAASCTAELPVTLELTSDASSTDKTFTVEITGEDADTPMPTKSVLTFTGSGTKSFTGFNFTELKDYHYTVKQTTADEAGYTIDYTEYSVTIRIVNSQTAEGEYYAEIWLSSGGEDTKPGEIIFNNSFTQASITVTKTCRLNGERIGIDYTFYGALFSDAAGTNRVSAVKDIEVKLADNGKVSVSFDNLPAGTYYFFETDADGNVIYQTVDGLWVVLEGCQGQSFTIDNENRYADMWLVNDFMEIPPVNYTYVPEDEDDPWIEEYSENYPDYSHGKNPVPPPTPTPAPTLNPSGNPTGTPTSPVTGDETNTDLFILIAVLAGAFTLILIGVRAKLRRKSEH